MNRLLTLSTLATLAALTLSACGQHFEVADSLKQKLFTTPTTILTPTTSEATTNEYSVYKLSLVKIGFDSKTLSISSEVHVDSTAGSELVDLVGVLRPDGTASLVDVTPLADAKNRLVAEAFCVDAGTCNQVILNVYYNVEGKTLKRQFSSDSLKVPPPQASAPAVAAPSQEDTPHPSEKNLPPTSDPTDTVLGDFVGAPRNEILIGKLWPRSKTPELPPVMTRADDPSLKTVIKPSAPKGSDWPKKTPSVKAPATTKAPAATKGAAAKDAKATPLAKPKEDARLDKTLTHVTPTEPQPSPETKGFIDRWVTKFQKFLVPDIAKAPKRKPRAKTVAQPPVPTTVKPAAGKTPPVGVKTDPTKTQPKATAGAPAQKPAPPAVPATQKPTQPTQTTPPAPPTSPNKAKPEPTKPPGPTREEKPKPQQPPPVPPQTKSDDDKSSAADDSAADYPFPPAKPDPKAPALDQKIELLEAKLAPLMNLRDGGKAQGGYTDSIQNGVRSALKSASVLPTGVDGLVPVQINHSAHYGSGMLVSFLENAATYLFDQLGLKLFVGDMSLKGGGAYGNNSSHNTHRNGLDADIAWIGWKRPLVDSALDDKGDVVKDFDYDKTWNFLKLAAHQEIIEDAQKETAVSRVYMSPGIKVGFCAWAKQKGLMESEFDSELLRLVRPTAGHYKHFHLSFKCSPHYPLCRNLAGPPPPGPGCN